MAYVDQYAAAADLESTLNKQVVAAIIKAAADVKAEDPATANHANRLAWATKVSRHDAAVQEMALRRWEILSNSTIAAAPATATDNDVQFVVNSFVNQWANE